MDFKTMRTFIMEIKKVGLEIKIKEMSLFLKMKMEHLSFSLNLSSKK
jgi:hypothetical protein